MSTMLQGTGERWESSIRSVNHPIINYHSGVCDQAIRDLPLSCCVSLLDLRVRLHWQAMTCSSADWKRRSSHSSAPIQENLSHDVRKVSQQRPSPWSAIQRRKCVAATCRSVESQHQSRNKNKPFASTWGKKVHERQPTIWLNLGNNATY